MTTNDYPIRFADQLRQHLRALRKRRGLTQAQVGSLVGVSQARIAEIEANPGLVNFEQILQLLSALGVTMTLEEEPSASIAPNRIRGVKRGVKNKPAILSGSKVTYTQSGVQRTSEFAPDYTFNTPPGKWGIYSLRAGPNSSLTGVLVTPAAPDDPSGRDHKSHESTASRLKELRALNPDKEVQPTSQRNFVIRPKKGSW